MADKVSKWIEVLFEIRIVGLLVDFIRLGSSKQSLNEENLKFCSKQVRFYSHPNDPRRN